MLLIYIITFSQIHLTTHPCWPHPFHHQRKLPIMHYFLHHLGINSALCINVKNSPTSNANKEYYVKHVYVECINSHQPEDHGLNQVLEEYYRKTD